jgi:aromatic ring-cleaving dioxygenase
MSRRPWQFTFTYADLADLTGKSVGAVKRAKYKRQFDPRDFESVARWLEQNKPRTNGKEEGR